MSPTVPRPPGPPALPAAEVDEARESGAAESRKSAAALVAPVSRVLELPDDTTGESTTDGELIPQAARTKPPAVAKRPPTRKLSPGDLICGQCGEGNKPTRKFCSRCGESLATAQSMKLKWWQRLLPKRRKAKVLAAGSRPSAPNKRKGRTAVRSVWRKIRALGAVIVLTAGVLAGFYPPARTWVVNQVNAVKEKLTGAAETALSPVHPASVKGSAEVKGHGAKLALDEFKNTYWLAPWSESKHPILTVKLEHKVALKKLIVLSGASGAFIAHDRPQTLHLTYSNEKSETVSLQDTSKQQEISLNNGLAVDVVQIEVTAVFPAQGAKDVALTEVELFGIG